MIGKVTFQEKGQTVEVVLEDDGTVSSDEERWQKDLEQRLEDYQYSPAHGSWGTRPLVEFAKEVGGKVVFEQKKKPESPDGSPIVY
jgi:hypothetical protein